MEKLFVCELWVLNGWEVGLGGGGEGGVREFDWG